MNMETKKYIEQKKFIFILPVLFTFLLYLFFYIYFDSEIIIEDQKYKNYYDTYVKFIPLILWIISFVSILFLSFIKFILRWKKFFFTSFVYILSFWIFLLLWMDLTFLEKRYADFMKAVILSFWEPLIYSSLLLLIFIIFLTLKNIKK